MMDNDQPEFRLIDLQDLPESNWNPAQISSHQNAIGTSPFPILYLWNFSRQDSLRVQLVNHGWAFLGPVQLLVSPAARIESPLMQTREDIRKAAKNLLVEPGKYKCPKLIDYEYRPTYSGFPINPLWCTDQTWSYGFQIMAKQSEYFVADLTSDERPDGLLHEINHLFNFVQLEKVIFLVDSSIANIPLIRDFLLSAWNSMPRSSVNQGKGDLFPPLFSYRSSNLGYMLKATFGIGKAAIPVAQKAANYMNWGRL